MGDSSGMRNIYFFAEPLKDASVMARRADDIMQHLRSQGTTLRRDADMMAYILNSTLETLRKGVAAEDLKDLEAFEAKATAELETAKKVRGPCSLHSP